ncbi:hypothetical protein [Caballeronia glebae]|jgi:hypothetical protein|uniref:hypothetical protein n=1 Tax=Caballeronia glebae TaxID=1777143 RepID=UPI0038BB9904
MLGFFRLAGDVIGTDDPVLTEKPGRASPHWIRDIHTLARGAELTTARDIIHSCGSVEAQSQPVLYIGHRRQRGTMSGEEGGFA